jgi:general secretion pathway protein F
VPGWIYVLCSAIFITLIRRFSRLTDWVRWHTPGLHWIELNRGLGLMLRTLRMAMRAGMNLEPAVRLAADVDVNQRLRPQVLQFADLLSRGTNPREAARRAGFGEVAATALATGQRTGDMEAALNYAVDYYNAMLSRWWIMLRNVAWPASTLAAGCIVGFVVYAIFQPLVALIDGTCNYWGH